MRPLILLISFLLTANTYAIGQSVITKTDNRKVLFYYSDSKTLHSDKISKKLARLSDSSMIKKVQLLIELTNFERDTIDCIYSNGKITYNTTDMPMDSISMLSLLIGLTSKPGRNTLNEILTIPFKKIYEETNNQSNI